MKLIFDSFDRMLLITNDKSDYANRLRLRLAYLKFQKEFKETIETNINKLFYERKNKPTC